MKALRSSIVTSILLIYILLPARIAYCQDYIAYYTTLQCVNALVDDGDDLWIATTTGIVKLDKTTETPTFYDFADSDLAGCNVSALCSDRSGGVWTGYWDGILQHFIEWDATPFPSGLYILSLKAGEYTQTKKLILQR